MCVCLLDLANWLRSGVGLASINGVDGCDCTEPALIPKDTAIGFTAGTAELGLSDDEDWNVRLGRNLNLNVHRLLLVAPVRTPPRCHGEGMTRLSRSRSCRNDVTAGERVRGTRAPRGVGG